MRARTIGWAWCTTTSTDCFPRIDIREHSTWIELEANGTSASEIRPLTFFTSTSGSPASLPVSTSVASAESADTRRLWSALRRYEDRSASRRSAMQDMSTWPDEAILARVFTAGTLVLYG